MDFEYNGYTLEIQEVIKDGVLVDYKGTCKELGNFTISGLKGYTNMTDRFKTEVDLHLENREQTAEELGEIKLVFSNCEHFFSSLGKKRIT